MKRLLPSNGPQKQNSKKLCPDQDSTVLEDTNNDSTKTHANNSYSQNSLVNVNTTLPESSAGNSKNNAIELVDLSLNEYTHDNISALESQQPILKRKSTTNKLELKHNNKQVSNENNTLVNASVNSSVNTDLVTKLPRNVSDSINNLKPSDKCSGNMEDLKIDESTSMDIDIVSSSAQQQSPYSSGAFINAADNQYRLVPVNCPEKIIFVVDAGQEVGEINLPLQNGGTCSLLDAIKRALRNFIRLKITLSTSLEASEFAIVELKKNAKLICGFSTPKHALNAIEKLNSDLISSKSCDISSVLDLIHEHLDLPQGNTINHLKPPYVVRVILVYTRSTLVPTLKNELPLWLRSPFFTFDALFIHDRVEKPTVEESPLVDLSDDGIAKPLTDAHRAALAKIKQIQDVFDFFVSMDVQGRSYIFYCEPTAVQIYNSFAKLLPHSLQRPPQHLAKYSISSRQHTPESGHTSGTTSRESSTESSSTLSASGILVDIDTPTNGDTAPTETIFS